MHPSFSQSMRRMINTKLSPVRVKYVAPEDKIKMWRIVRGDEVQVMSGKEKGKTGLVSKVLRGINSVTIADTNMVTKHIRPHPDDPSKATRVQIEAPIHVSNVSLIDPMTREPVRTHYREVVDPKSGKSKRLRYIVGTEVQIPKPKADSAKYKSERIENVKDTKPADATAITFIPDVTQYPFPSTSVVAELANPYSKYRRA